MPAAAASCYKPDADYTIRNWARKALFASLGARIPFARHLFRLPIVAALLLILAMPSQAQRAISVKHVVRPGETLGLIAQRYGVNIYELAAVNGISNAHLVYSWQQLAIPGEAISASVEAAGTHIVKPGETLDSIARFYGIDLLELQTLNNLWTWLIYAGDELALPAAADPSAIADSADDDETPQPAAETEASEYTHIVQRGESLGAIAESYGVSLYDLQRLNGAWSFLIYPGQKLAIPAGGQPSTTVPAARPAESADIASPALPAPAVRADTHTVQRGETLFSIARQYELPVDLLMSANGISDPRRVHSGLVLRIRNLDAPPAVTTSSPSASPGQNPASSAQRERYTVLPGESLSTIGNKLGMSWVAIAAVNGIANPDRLSAGAILQVPTASEAAAYGPVRPAPTDPGARIGSGKELIVVLNTQMAYAYENGVLQRSALISSGLPDTPTVRGDFKITRKLRSRHMVGPGYDLPNVPWVMYFFAGYAFHGTYWHNNFGTPMSHGCVNMTNADAQWFYNFAPVGTPVHVRY